jgi:5-methylcytosine-specific restriction protein A
VTVNRTTADLSYEAHVRFNLARWMALGVMHLQFTGPDRRTVSQVLWRERGEEHFQSFPTAVDVGAEVPAEDLAEEADDADEEEFPEGRVLYRLHRRRERNRELVRGAKAAALRRTGILACVVCDFDFREKYGPLGKGFIECHHVVPVSELPDGAATRLADVVVVCPNCHRMLHRKRPWLRVGDLKAILATGSKPRRP